MREHELDYILSREREIVPSAQFTRSVMNTVRSEAAAPPPIPFPWLRALPGLAAGVLAVFWTVIEAFRLLESTQQTESAFLFPSWIDRLAQILRAGESAGIGWVLLSLIVTRACWELTWRIAGRRA